MTGASDIAAVTIQADPANHADQFQNGPTKRRPTQVVQAQFAQPFLIATALHHGRVGIADVAGLGTPEVLALSDTIQGEARADKPRSWLSVTVRHQDGRTVTIEATDPTGSPAKPLSAEQSAAKFRDNARNAIRPPSDTVVDRALDMLANLETQPDIRRLIDPFA